METTNNSDVTTRVFREADWQAIVASHDAGRPDELPGSCDARAFVPLAEDLEREDLRRSHILVATGLALSVLSLPWMGTTLAGFA